MTSEQSPPASPCGYGSRGKGILSNAMLPSLRFPALHHGSLAQEAIFVEVKPQSQMD